MIWGGLGIKQNQKPHICSSYMLGPTQLWDFMTLRPRLASELGVRDVGSPRVNEGDAVRPAGLPG